MFFFMMITTDYQKRVQANKYTEWDIKTITAGDYTVEIKITPIMWYTFETKTP